MYRLTCFELDKVWRKRSFLLSVAVLLAINIFLLWYTNLPNNETPPLSAYKAVEKDLQHLSEAEKKSFIEDLYEDSKGVMLVNDILNMQNSATDTVSYTHLRLKVIEIKMPELKAHRQDIPLLCSHFIHHYNQQQGKNVQYLTKEAEKILMTYHFPGNIRELSNICLLYTSLNG